MHSRFLSYIEKSHCYSTPYICRSVSSWDFITTAVAQYLRGTQSCHLQLPNSISVMLPISLTTALTLSVFKVKWKWFMKWPLILCKVTSLLPHAPVRHHLDSCHFYGPVYIVTNSCMEYVLLHGAGPYFQICICIMTHSVAIAWKCALTKGDKKLEAVAKFIRTRWVNAYHFTFFLLRQTNITVRIILYSADWVICEVTTCYLCTASCNLYPPCFVIMYGRWNSQYCAGGTLSGIGIC